MIRRFVIVSGLPASGKSTLARRIAPALDLPVLDKDVILERLFEEKGIGDRAWRRTLSRESDLILQDDAIASQGAVLVSHWRLPGMAPESGTPTEWLRELSGHRINLHCACAPEIAAERFVQRQRHPGHRDGAVPYAAVLADMRTASSLGRLDVAESVEVDTIKPPALEAVLHELREAFRRCAGG